MPLAAIDAAAAPKKIYAVHVDHLNRPIMLTDAAKASVWSAIYEPFGRVHSVTGAVTQNLGLPGQWFQFEHGLAYNWHRHYDPTTGRYTTADPLGFIDGPSVFAYAGSAPHAKVDPSGLDLADDILEWLGPGALCVPTPKGAVQFISADRKRVIRFDISPSTSHGLSPHINISPGNKHIWLK